ncbi:polysaccharide biosynthesis C-terminal domain-containing protein, partial [bacterium]|nr:polysaccharide biosynthesis C-terminal domain-containing protein [bacterium]
DDIVRGLHFFGPEYWDGVKIVPVVMLAYVFYGLYVNLIVGIYIKKKSIYLPYITGAGALVNIGLNILLIPVWGIMGAAVAAAVSYFIMAGLMFASVHKIYPIQYEYARLAKIVIIAGICFTAGYWGYAPFQPFLKIALFILFPLLLKLTGFFEKEEIAKLKEKIRSVKKGASIGESK